MGEENFDLIDNSDIEEVEEPEQDPRIQENPGSKGSSARSPSILKSHRVGFTDQPNVVTRSSSRSFKQSQSAAQSPSVNGLINQQGSQNNQHQTGFGNFPNHPNSNNPYMNGQQQAYAANAGMNPFQFGYNAAMGMPMNNFMFNPQQQQFHPQAQAQNNGFNFQGQAGFGQNNNYLPNQAVNDIQKQQNEISSMLASLMNDKNKLNQQSTSRFPTTTGSGVFNNHIDSVDYDSSMMQVSHSQMDRKAFKKLHPWSPGVQQMFGVMEGVRNFNQLDDVTILRAVNKYMCFNKDDQPRNALLNYAIWKSPSFSSTNKSSNAKDSSSNSSIFKSLVIAIDASIADGTPLKTSNIDTLAVEFQFHSENNNQARRHPETSASGKWVRGNKEHSKEKVCFAYNRADGCSNSTCSYPHRCGDCGGQHPKIKCPKSNK